MNEHLEAALLRCTEPRVTRPICAKPFAAVVEDRRVRVATNAKTMLMVDDPQGDPEDDGSKEKWPSWRAVIAAHMLPPAHFISRERLARWAGQDYRHPCPDCDDGLTGAKKCAKCDGAGEVTCEYDHDHDCPDCDGNGRTGKTCAACNGVGNVFDQLAPINARELDAALDVLVDAHLIGGLFDLLPGDEIGMARGPKDSAGSLAFRGPGWLLVVYGLRP